MRNVLFIVYYFPPMGGSGVQRPLKFIKYLREFGWNPIIVCPEPGLYPYFDESLDRELKEIDPEIHRVKADTLFQKVSGSSSSKKGNLPNGISKALRRFLRLFMYPDNKKGWTNPAVEKGKEIIDSKNIHLIFSTAPPFSNHIVGAKLKKYSGIPLVLDYRDAWLNNHFMDGMFGWQKKKMKKLERNCIKQADQVLGLDEFMLEEMNRAYEDEMPASMVIPHGFDAQDFKHATNPSIEYHSGKLNFLYSGIFYESNQPDVFLRAVRKAAAQESIELQNIHLHFQGGLDRRIKNLIAQLGLSAHVTDYGYVTHEKAVANLKEADVLWMVSDFNEKHRQVKSGKLFEYFGTGKPVLGMVNEGKAKDLLTDYGAGYASKPRNIDELVKVLSEIYQDWKRGSLPKSNQEFISGFERKFITEKLANIFDKISGQ